MRFFWLLLLATCVTSKAFGQIVDDSTQVIDGYRTTIFRLPHFTLLDSVGRRLDTGLVDFQETDEYLWQGRERQKNLGFLGSAQSPLFASYSTEIGRTLGLDQTKYLTLDPDSVHFYRTYNVLSRLKYNQGSFGRQWILVEATKNLSSTFNVGFLIRRLTSQRQIGVQATKQKVVDHTSYCLHFNGSLLKGKYLIMGSLSEFRQSTYETGGLILNNDRSYDSLFDYTLSVPRFVSNAVTSEGRRNVRLHQLFRQGAYLPEIKITAGLDNYRNRFDLDLNRGINPNAGYESLFLSSSNTENRLQYELIFLKPSVYYFVQGVGFEVFADVRRHRYSSQNLLIANTPEQVYGTNLTFTKGWLQGRLSGSFVPNRDRRFGAQIWAKGFTAEVAQSQISPTFFAQNLISNHFQWRNNFALVELLHVQATYTLRMKAWNLRAYVRNQTVRNAIFYSDLVNPFQEASAVNNLVGNIQSDFTYRKLFLLAQLQGANPSRRDLLPQPRYFARVSPALHFGFKKGKYQLMPGVDFWFRDSFLGQAYEPSIGVFHLQGEGQANSAKIPKFYLLKSYIWSSVFVNIKINNTRAYVKLGNALQGIGTSAGFFDVPFNPGQRRYFEFGLDWVFYD